ncbi:iron donor protein CyaY [Pajaroellobacter abortibovis]|nr:iron donor protein CyaY [Pajaroellobacter abortibovis]
MESIIYDRRVEDVFRRLDKGLEKVDCSLVDYNREEDVVKMTFRNGKQCVLNTRRAASQIWLAARAKGWHFSYDEASGQWIDGKHGRMELFSTIASIVQEESGLVLQWGE